MRRLWTLTPAVLLVLIVVGCGGGGDDPGPAPGRNDGGTTQQVGPFVIRTAATAGFHAQNIPSDGDAAFVALSGAKITYLGIQEMLDRIVYSGSSDIWVCDLFGENAAQLTTDGATVHDNDPAWSPDGTRVAWDASAAGSGYYAIWGMDADGSNKGKVSPGSTEVYQSPTWSPDGLMLACEYEFNMFFDLVAMNSDGTGLHAVIGNPDDDEANPHWARDGSGIYYETDEHGNYELYRVDEDGSNPTRLTTDTYLDTNVCVSPDGNTIAWCRSADIWIASSDGSSQRKFAESGSVPCFSTCGSLLVFVRSNDLWAKEVAPPYREYQVTATASKHESDPDLGSPTPQIRRVLIGAAGADHGYDPLWTYVYAAIVAFDDTGYLNFLRIGIPSNDCDTIEVEPIPDTGDRLVGLRVEADNILNLREDQGIGEDPSWWNIVAESPSAVLLYLDAHTGKLVSVLLTRDTVYPAAAGSVAHTLDGSTLRVAGDIAAAYVNGGELVAEDVGTIEFECARLVRAF